MVIFKEHGETALHLAAMYGRLNVTKYLVEQAGISVMIRTKEVNLTIRLIICDESIQLHKIYMQHHFVLF